MTPQQYIEWLDKEIKKCEYGKNHFDWHSHNTSLQCFQEAKEKFLTIEFPSPTDFSIQEHRRIARETGFDDYCEAHQLAYDNECPECAKITQPS